MAIKIPMILTTIVMKIMMKLNYTTKIVKGDPNDNQDKTNAHPKKSPIDCHGVLLTNVQWHMVSLSIL